VRTPVKIPVDKLPKLQVKTPVAKVAVGLVVGSVNCCEKVTAGIREIAEELKDAIFVATSIVVPENISTD
jgi:hypothetical protein